MPWNGENNVDVSEEYFESLMSANFDPRQFLTMAGLKIENWNSETFIEQFEKGCTLKLRITAVRTKLASLYVRAFCASMAGKADDAIRYGEEAATLFSDNIVLLDTESASGRQYVADNFIISWNVDGEGRICGIHIPILPDDWKSSNPADFVKKTGIEAASFGYKVLKIDEEAYKKILEKFPELANAE